jgi:ABC-type Zn uptake system ZnuABC Zn-binding protein ZnuA
VVPDGQDPHSFQPSETELQIIREADFVVANGLHFETGIDSALEAARREGKPIFYAIDYVTGRLSSDEDESHDHADEHNHGEIDLHLWLSPFTMRQMIPELSRQLGGFLNTDLGAKTDFLLSELDALDADIARAISAVDNCAILVNHDEFGYFAERYGCISQTVFVPTTVEEVASATSTKTQEAARRSGVTTVFVNKLLPPGLVDEVALAIGTRVVAIPTHTMGTLTTYPQFMRSLVATLVAALAS